MDNDGIMDYFSDLSAERRSDVLAALMVIDRTLKRIEAKCESITIQTGVYWGNAHSQPSAQNPSVATSSARQAAQEGNGMQAAQQAAAVPVVSPAAAWATVHNTQKDDLAF